MWSKRGEVEPPAVRVQQRSCLQSTDKLDIAADQQPELDLDTVASHWQLALDAAQHALTVSGGSLTGAELKRRRGELLEERQQTTKALARLAETTRVWPAPWMSTTPVTARMIGLPTNVRACLFDLDGVLTDSGILHAWAWAEVFDDFLLRFTEKTGWHFVPFDHDADYRAYIDGRPRLEGVHAFLGSRGIRLPEGRPADPAQADTAYGLAKHKSEALERGLRQRGVTALAGSRRYLEAAGHAGLKRAVISASASTLPMLELAGLATLVEEHVDADLIRVEGLRSRPAPDVLLSACRRLDIRPDQAATFTHDPAGIAAGRAAELTVIGIGDSAQGELLHGFGAEHVVPSLGALLDRQLTAGQ